MDSQVTRCEIKEPGCAFGRVPPGMAGKGVRHPQGRGRHHGEMLTLSGAVVFLAFALEVRPDQRVAFRGWADYPLPETCMARSLYDISCPGCGLTRSFVHLAHGNWHASVTVHRAGWVLALAVLLQFPYRLALLLRGEPSPALLRACHYFGYFLILLLLVAWVVKSARIS